MTTPAKPLGRRAAAAATRRYRDMPHLGALSMTIRQKWVAYRKGYIAGYRAAKRRRKEPQP